MTAYTLTVIAQDSMGQRATKTASFTVTDPVPTGVVPSWNPNGVYAAPVFSDDFEGSSLNSRYWSTSWFNGSVMNNVSTSAANVSVANSQVALTLASSSVGALIDTDPSQVPSGGFQFGAGYCVEARVFFPGSGTTIYNWPAFWTDGQHWPTNGENDIAEGLGTMTSNYQYPGGPNNSGTIPGNWGGSWHNYGLERLSGKNNIYYDGKLVRTYSTVDGGSPHYLIFNVGRGNQGVYGANSKLLVDWVRVWKSV